MVVSCVRFISLGWIHDQYIQPMWHFPYDGFDWVQPLGATGMYMVFAIMLLAAICVTLGAWYRISSVLFFLTFTYVELLDKTYYLNHYYFVSIMAAMLALLPAHTAWSVDTWLRPRIKQNTVPRWMVDAVKFQISLVYIYAGLAKINYSWLIEAMPLRIWLPANDTLPIIGPLMTVSWIPWVFSWAGMLYDVTIPFWLMNKRTRLFAYCAVITFHTVTGMLFQIGVFPLVMSSLALVFFFPWQVKVEAGVPAVQSMALSPPRLQRVIAGVLGVHLVLQVLLPWRYLLQTNDVFWDEAGYRFGWRVMLMEKAGTALFSITDRKTGRTTYVNNSDFLNAHQEKQMAMQPDMVLQYAHMLRTYFSERGMVDPIIKADVWVTLNGAPGKQLIDPNADLSRMKMGWTSNEWILPR